MEYNVEDISPVKKKITVNVPAEEVNASLSATTALYRQQVDIKGFRKGKVPSSVIEGKFKKQIYSEASQELINLHINQIMSEINLEPVSGIEVDAGEMVRGKDFNYSISFEVAPEIDLPEYNGIEIQEEEVQVNEEEVRKVIDHIRNQLAEYEIVDEDRPPRDGESAIIDFAAYQDDKPVEGARAENFQINLGEGQALEDFENLVKSLKPGEKGEGPVIMPDDFLNPELAGKEINMKVTLHSVKQKVLPELDDELAKKAGAFESADQMKETIEKSYIGSRKQLHKSAAQKKALDALKDQLEYELPPALVNFRIEQKIAELRQSLESKGKSFESLGKTREELQEEFREEAEDLVKSQLFLLAVARKEELTVTQQEMDAYLQSMAKSSKQSYQELKNFYEQNNLMFVLRDALLADKAMEHIYSRARITKIPPAEAEETQNQETQDQG